MTRFASLCPAGVVQWQDLSFPSSRRGFDSHRPLHSSFYFSLSWRAAKAHEGLQPAWPAVAALPEIPIRQRPAPSGNARPQSAGAGLGKHQSGPGKARIQAQAPLPHDGRKPAPKAKESAWRPARFPARFAMTLPERPPRPGATACRAKAPPVPRFHSFALLRPAAASGWRIPRIRPF